MWRRFYALEAALEFCKAADGELLVIALDKASSGAKVFVVTTPHKAHAACFGLLAPHDMDGVDPDSGENQYELVRGDEPARLYYDGDFAVARNPGRDPNAAKEALHYYAQQAYAHLPAEYRPPGMAQLRFVVETAHDPTIKFSNHGKSALECGIVVGRLNQRAFWAHAMVLALADLESADSERQRRAACLRVATAACPEGDWFWDKSVYSRNRFMRMLGATKPPKDGQRRRYLVPEGAESRNAITFEQWNSARITNVGANPFILTIPASWHDEAAVIWGSSRAQHAELGNDAVCFPLPAWQSHRHGDNDATDELEWTDATVTTAMRDLVNRVACEAFPAWAEAGHLDPLRLHVQVAHMRHSLSLLPRIVRIKPRTTYCPLKEGDHDTEACVLDVHDDGTRWLRCLSHNHPNARSEWFCIKPDNVKHRELASLLSELWGPAAWLRVLHQRYAHVKGLRDRNIVEVYRNRGGKEVVAFHSRNELTELWHGMRVFSRTEPPSNRRGSSSEVPLWSVDRNPFALWYQSPQRQRYDGIVYDPNPSSHVQRAEFNMFRGFGVQPLPSDNPAPSILAHLREVMCCDNLECFNYLVDCLAYLVQHPDRKLEIVLVFLGEKGTGKNALSTVMHMIFGAHALEIVDTNHFTGRFNAHLSHVNLIVLNEAVWGGDKQAESILKSATTDARSMVEAKYGTPELRENKWSLMVLTNSDFPVPITLDDRRFFVLRTSSARRGDSDYFDRLYNSIHDGMAVREFFGFLLRRSPPAAGWRPAQRIPRTAAWVDVMLHNAEEAALAWLVSKAREGRWEVPRAQWPNCTDVLIPWNIGAAVPKWVALQAAQAEVDRARHTRFRPTFVGSMTAFTQAMKRYLPNSLFSETFRHDARGAAMYWFASMRDIRAFLALHVLHVPDYFDAPLQTLLPPAVIAAPPPLAPEEGASEKGDAMDIE